MTIGYSYILEIFQFFLSLTFLLFFILIFILHMRMYLFEIDIYVIFLEYSYFYLSGSCKEFKILMFGNIPFLYFNFLFYVFKRFKNLFLGYKEIVQIFTIFVPELFVRRMQFHKVLFIYFFHMFLIGRNITIKEQLDSEHEIIN